MNSEKLVLDVKKLFASGEEPDLVVIEADCNEAMRWIPDSIINLTVTDPAYESLERHRAKGTTTRLKESKASSNAWFKTFPNTSYWSLFSQLHRVHAKDSHCYVFCDSETEHAILNGRNPYDDKSDTELLNYQIDITARPSKCADCQDWGLVRPIDCDPPWKAWPPLTWVKTKKDFEGDGDALTEEAVRAGLGYHWRRADERILFLEKGKRKLHNLGEPNIVCGPRAGSGDYPTQKPTSIVSRLIANSSDPDDLVLDMFAGSGVVGFEALRLGRRAILIDVDVSWICDHLDLATHHVVRVFRSSQQ
jgi:site-specific DNA-methyltransferase (adenine-specific)